ncbi:MAG: hypothetical protein ACJ766_04690, partial [Thermoleophilaceae bacterium]
MSTAAGEQESAKDLVHEVVVRRLGLVGWAANAAGILVVAASVVFLIPVFLDPDQTARFVLLNAPVAVAYYLGVGLLIGRHFSRVADELDWIGDGREPSEREHRLALGLAMQEVKGSA